MAKKKEIKQVKKTQESLKDDEFELNFDFKKIFNKKNLSLFMKVLPIILIIGLMIYSFSIRDGSIDLEGLKPQVENNFYGQLQQMVYQQVRVEMPNLQGVYLQEEVNKRFNEILKTRTMNYSGQLLNIDEIINQNFENVKASFQIDGQTYLTAIDPYMYYRYSNNILERGHHGESLKEFDGEMYPVDDFRVAPEGRKLNKKADFHTQVLATAYKFSGLDKDSTIAQKFKAIFILPVVIVCLTMIPLFFLLRKLTNNYAATLGSLIVTSVSVFVSRTTAGFVDTDAYNVFFPVLITCLLVFGVLTKNWKKAFGLSLIAGFFQANFLWAWGYGWFIFLFLSVSLIGYIFYQIVVDLWKNKFKKFDFDKVSLISSLTYIFSSFVFTFWLLGQNIFKIVYSGLYGSLSGLASISKTNIWPNVLSSVAELNSASMTQIYQNLGSRTSPFIGQTIIFLGLLGLFYLTLNKVNLKEIFVLSSKKLKEKHQNILLVVLNIFGFVWFSSVVYGGAFMNLTANHKFIYLIFMFLPIAINLLLNLLTFNKSYEIFLGVLFSSWFAGTIYMSLNGVRFILLLAPVVGICFGLGVFYITKYLDNVFSREFNLKKNFYICSVLFFVLFLFLFVPIHKQANAISDYNTPNLTDKWYETLIAIKENSSEDAIISSWWDFGHEFIAIADRGATFDGGSQTTPQSHWIGKILMESDENVAIGTLRMLVCSGNKGFEYAYSLANSSDRGVNIVENLLYKILPINLTNEQRLEIIKSYPYYEFTDSEAEELLNLVACDKPADNYFITSEDMVGKSGVWAHWGSWNFTKKFVYDNYNVKTVSEIAQILDRDESVIQKLKDEIVNIEFEAKTTNYKFEDLINRWLADYPSYYNLNQGDYLKNCQVSDNKVELICEMGIKINLLTMKVEGLNNYVKRLIVPQNNSLKVIDQNKEGQLDLTLIPVSATDYRLLPSVYPLGDSIFTRLFYLNGYSTEYFKPFKSVNTVLGWKVDTWKVDWEKKEIKTISSNDKDNNVSLENKTDVKIADLNLSLNNNS